MSHAELITHFHKYVLGKTPNAYLHPTGSAMWYEAGTSPAKHKQLATGENIHLLTTVYIDNGKLYINRNVDVIGEKCVDCMEYGSDIANIFGPRTTSIVSEFGLTNVETMGKVVGAYHCDDRADSVNQTHIRVSIVAQVDSNISFEKFIELNKALNSLPPIHFFNGILESVDPSWEVSKDISTALIVNALDKLPS